MKLWNRIRYFTRRRNAERELEQEFQAHRAMTEDRLRSEGMTETEARAAASQKFGNMTLALEDSRGAWNFAWLESLGQDIRYALRCFRNAPLFSLTVILTIGLALGLNTILFTAFNAYVLAPFAVQDPYSLYSIAWNTKSNSGGVFSWEEFQSLQRSASVTQNNSAYTDFLAMVRATARVNGDTLRGELVSGNYFSMLGVSPELGRTIIPSDAVAPGANAVIVLTYAAWKSKFQEDPSVIGRTILLRGRPFEIIGVARRGFAGINNTPPDFWAPLTMYNQLLNGADFFGLERPRSVEIVGRVNPRFQLEQARASLLVTSKALTANYPPENKVINVSLQSNATTFPLTLEIIQTTLPAAIALGLILLLACANVANMMLARAMTRQREIGLRLAIGASRARLIRQLLTEGFVLALPAAALGFGITWLGVALGTKGLFAIIPSAFASQIRVVPIHLDWRVFTFVLVAGCLSTLAFALVPAWQATRGDLISATRGEFTGWHQSGRLRNILVAAQVSICVMLLISSGILLRGSHHAESVDFGLDVHNVIEIDTRQDLRSKVSAILAADPAVEPQATVWATPLYGFARTMPVATHDQPNFVYSGYNFVSPQYFDVFRVPIERGRNFTIEEARAGSPVVIVSETTARKLWPQGNALSETLRIKKNTTAPARTGDASPQFTTSRVIGIASNAASDAGIFGVDKGCVYFPVNPAITYDYPLLVRVRGNAEIVRRSLDQTLSNLTPGAVTQMIPMEQVIEMRYLPFRAFAWLSESLGGLALALTAIGIYGVIAYLVTQRTREIGIRIALGASSRSVVQLILSQSIRLATIGVAVGALIALGAGKLVSSRSLILRVFDPGVYAVSISIVLAAAALAAAIPARRASKLDAMTVLRHE